MALITCPECGRQISDRAPACVGCGIPMEDIREILREQQAASKKTADESQAASDSYIHNTLHDLCNREVTCIICKRAFKASELICPDCSYPVMSFSGVTPDLQAITSYRIEKGFYSEEKETSTSGQENPAGNAARSSRNNEDLPPGNKIIGIDFGTTNCRVSVMEGGKPVLIRNKEGYASTPAVVGFTGNGEILVGEAAKRQAITNPDRTVTSIRRMLGNDYKISIDGNLYHIEDIASMLLAELKHDAESYLGERVTDAVITIPETFSFTQRQAVQRACKSAGLNVKRLLHDPSATALAYGLDKTKDKQKVLIYDLGGGTLDVSVIEIGDGVIEVLSINGDAHLGGEEFDNALVQYLIESFRQEHGVDLRRDRLAHQRLKDAAEKAKKDLSVMQSVRINLPLITATSNGPLHMDIEVTRAWFERLTSSLIDKAIKPISSALSDAGIRPSAIDKVILAGGSTRIPAIQEAVRRALGKELFRGINPEECVAMGAAIQAGILSGEVMGTFVVDVMPMSLSIETMGGVATRIIDKNTPIPTKRSMIFSTAADNQVAVDIHILQGEGAMANENISLGTFRLSDIPPAKAGIPQIEVTFEVDTNGIINVRARDLGTGKEQKITVTSDPK